MRSDLPELPEWLLALLKRGRRKREKVSETPLAELDLPSSIARAIDWLTNNAPDAIEGAGGDHATYEVCARMRDFGLSEAVAFDVVAEHWNEAGKAAPAWSAEDLLQKVANAYRYGTGAVGGALGVAEFDDTTTGLTLGETDGQKPKGLYRVPFNLAASTALDRSAAPLIEELLDQEAMAVVYGPSNSGKTFLVLDLAFHVAAGRPWLGREVAKGLVIYVAAEGGRGIFKRIAALKKHYGVEDAALDIVPCPINLLDGRADVPQLIALAREAEMERGEPARMVVIDTVSRALAGGDENTSTDMGAFVKNADRVRAAVKSTMVLVHHSGKDVAKGARGWSGLRAATDTEIEILDGKIRVSKQRDMEAAADMSFRLDKVPIGHDAKGRAVSSCVLRVTTGNEFVKVELSGREVHFLEAFKEAAQATAEEAGDLENWRQTPTEWAAWVAAYKAAKGDGKGVDRSNLSKMRSAVVEGGWVLKTEGDRYVLA